jgi:hypothetical protein
MFNNACRIWLQIMAEKNQRRRAATKQMGSQTKRRLPEGSGVLFDHDAQRGIALSLAGLAATYSPRA